MSFQGDAEALPFADDSFDRYVSSGSIEYWPEPQRGVCEAYRVVRPGGIVCIIVPVYPTSYPARLIADNWMLFPTEQEYFKVSKCACCQHKAVYTRGLMRLGCMIGALLGWCKKLSCFHDCRPSWCLGQAGLA